MLVVFLSIFHGQNAQALRQQEQLSQLQTEAYAETMRGDRLRDQIRMAETMGFREREARRRYGYVRPGVIRFVAEEGLPAHPAEQGPPIYVGEQPPADFFDPEEELDKDWANFGN
ncbi:MAG: hypothetical protein FWE77_00980 [Clostridia bacterium]|nr:hypothetical protein [Clostridia bacterium]